MPPAATDLAVTRLRFISTSSNPSQLITPIVHRTQVKYLQLFGQRLEIDIMSGVGESALLDLLGKGKTRQLMRDRVDGTANELTPKLAKAIGNTLRQTPDQLPSVKAYASAAAAHLKPRSDFSGNARTIASELARIHIVQHQALARDGVINPASPNALLAEFNTWQALGLRGVDADIVVIDTLIASTELNEPDVHSALRGGISNGITVPTSSRSNLPNSRKNGTGALSVISLAPFLARSQALSKLRDAPQYTDDEAIEFAALMRTHELGHQLLKLGHPWGNAAFVMRPPVSLRFREWAKQLDPTKCKLGSEAAMTPGAITLAP